MAKELGSFVHFASLFLVLSHLRSGLLPELQGQLKIADQNHMSVPQIPNLIGSGTPKAPASWLEYFLRRTFKRARTLGVAQPHIAHDDSENTECP